VFEELIAGWSGERVVIGYDAPSGAWMFICMHSTRLGPAGGGTRMKVYESPADGLTDAMRLSAAMTSKLAAAGLPFGGGKAVLAVREIPDGEERRELLLRYAETVASLRGGFVTAPDVNTSESDMDVVAERAPGFVFCRSASNGGSGSSAPATAIGVFHGIRTTAQRVLGRDLEGLTVLVQGAGGVGGKLVDLLGRAGAVVVVSDIDAERAREAAASAGGTVVPADHATETECDVYAPCALGGTLNEESIPGLRCRIVAGAANNQLATPQDGERLAARGIVYAPDFVINAGGALHGAGIELLGWNEERLAQRLEAIGDTLLHVYDRAERDGTSTEAAAERLAEAKLAAASTTDS
jgi:glutamate dehydrogenase/leucine dehydrogenase